MDDVVVDVLALDASNVFESSTQSQQKCIANFALLCCLAVLVALIFSSVNIWEDVEEDITEDNCSRDCRIELVENIPEHLSFHADGSPRFPLSAGFHALLDQARYSVEMVSPVWDLNAWDVEAKQGQLLFQRLLRLVSRGVKLKIVSSLTNSAELKTLAEHSELLSHPWFMKAKHNKEP
ncbi:Inactive phospholipase D5 [Takifugu flavidus]|uniref:Inactive phospholipase D5 n=1 Tax=Takifugu flavidus TaxID=433684 RepID=A0A5C6MYW3_9TELE|nr:Inactive phospholipase D5 [Takifugu flavidus]